ncbi:transcriptional regulator with XRE-family HTH domain [Kineococcus radiotolerans]|uniref:Transcriptional regulator with XRE-family HTH domain n=1 Tax=Kineococcus radiotolerans TaxID=131568 RepID=A0A7W4XX63_KINRA|nr:helix-turn-helix transcriptional regulator [Kineococcus radiotolerans]MBB2900855.1 transcriptional regulator with XRE-family HTH domain [Kineococcus radiotolerans]
MEQDIDAIIRQRIRGLRLAKGWSLDALAARCFMSPSTLSRIETGHRRIALDQLVPLARALDTTLDDLVDSGAEDDVVIRPLAEHRPGVTTWLLSRERAVAGVTVAKTRLSADRHAHHRTEGEPRVHPGREWFTVLSGRAHLELGDRTFLVHPGEAAEFNTMTPHRITADATAGDLEILSIFDRDGERTHLRTGD